MILHDSMFVRERVCVRGCLLDIWHASACVSRVSRVSFVCRLFVYLCVCVRVSCVCVSVCVHAMCVFLCVCLVCLCVSYVSVSVYECHVCLCVCHVCVMCVCVSCVSVSVCLCASFLCVCVMCVTFVCAMCVRGSCVSRYCGVDTELSLKVDRLLLHCHRPTVAALMALGADLANVGSAQAASDPQV